jgi:DNA-binding MarR family transcriptional regulator
MSTTSSPARSQPERTSAGEWPPELRSLGRAFRSVFRSLSRMRGRDTHLVGGEISHAQLELLIELDERGELSAGDLALAARISPASVTQMLDGLVESGHVARTRSERDRRVVLASLTPRGHARIEAKRAAWQERWERALADVSEREMKAATKVLERLAEMFDQQPLEGPCETPAESAREDPETGRKRG